MKFINVLEQAKWHIKTLWLILAIVIGLEIFTLIGWMHSESKITVHIPPRIPESGLTLTQDAIPKSTVYSFAYYAWQQLNHWPKDGMTDYKQNIATFSAYLTPGFKNTLIANYNTRLNQGELQSRERTMQGIEGSNYSPKDVITLGHDTWLVHLSMRLTETMNNNANVVKDVDMHYTLKVVRYDVDATRNPWGLALAGFAQGPVRIKTIV